MGCVVALVAGIGAPILAARPAAAAVQCDGRAATIVGTEGSDTLNGTNGMDVIVGLGGNDLISAAGGNDVICADGGDDVIDGGADQDLLYGGTGDDTILGGAGTDGVMYSTSATAVVVDLRNQFAHGEGNDKVREIENVLGSRLDDRIYGDAQANLLAGLNGNDRPSNRTGNSATALSPRSRAPTSPRPCSSVAPPAIVSARRPCSTARARPPCA